MLRLSVVVVIAVVVVVFKVSLLVLGILLLHFMNDCYSTVRYSWYAVLRKKSSVRYGMDIWVVLLLPSGHTESVRQLCTTTPKRE